MIKVAKSKKSEGIEYLVHDMAMPLDSGMKFDVVFAMFLFQYCKNKEMLDLFVRNAALLLKPGGKIYAFNGFIPDFETLKDDINIDVDSEENKKRPLVTSLTRFPPQDFDPVILKYYVNWEIREGNRLSLNYHSIFPETLQKSFEANGFEQVKFEPNELDPNYDKQHEAILTSLDLNRTAVRWSAIRS
mmetsp:Transcript_24361/g.23968  ORF Transcript_24361/g.23968 Transcript_24361/m.23968 type:complete len:188 (+) Transcript_24361:228-791(+)